MKVSILLQQHVGGPCIPIVKINDMVKKGQLIAEPNGLGSNIHASVYGKVESIEKDRIIIEPSKEQPDEYVKIKNSDNYLELIKEAGVVGAGGAGFPTHVKLKTNLDGGCVIANAAECEPTLNHNMEMIRKEPEYVIKGLKYVMKITNARKGYIAIKPKHKRAVKILLDACKEDESIEVKFLPNMYPAGDERVIVREILNKLLEPGQLPIEANAVISNVETLKNIVLAIDKRRPVITKDITVGGRLNENKKGKVFLDVPIGVPVGNFIKNSGGYIEPHGEIVIGGPFTGRHGEEDTPIMKTSGGVLVSMPFPNTSKNIGLLACECGAQEERLKEIASGMGAKVVAVAKCKRMQEVNGRFRCDKPGICPGQAETVIYLKNHGAEAILAGSCEG